MIVRYGDRTSVVVSILALTGASIGASSASAASWSLSRRLSRCSTYHLECGVRATMDIFFLGSKGTIFKQAVRCLSHLWA
ncbi:uncharacterized protein K444DRAFT_615579 [Hyaloscypha bicolor E]|uniref:Uncharacterized protein n=1 Tax=Hyaloscypha bicolor E TaxID=1095630 RepID=A0A2J6T271_9HELO|nr:uncharacterized protein K444DRAFT_615579 [Hyaloscypha bicolor E]PMD57115.1 hypothetical protein K444DRAFT_615579 [Hyaloscypha bicolor E]